MAPSAFWLLAALLALACPQPLEAGLVEVIQRGASESAHKGRQLLAPNECIQKGLEGTCNGCVVSWQRPSLGDPAWHLPPACALCMRAAAVTLFVRQANALCAAAVLLLHRRRRHRHLPAHRHLHLCAQGGKLADLGHGDP